jgi:hypothetical protein
MAAIAPNTSDLVSRENRTVIPPSPLFMQQRVDDLRRTLLNTMAPPSKFMTGKERMSLESVLAKAFGLRS